MKNQRIYYFLFVIILLTMKYNKPLYEYSSAMQYPVTAYVLPFLLTSPPFMCIYYFCVIYVNSDIPFMQRSQLYQLVRIGRRKWTNAKVCGLFLRSFSIIIITFLISFITLLPNIDFSNRWGKLEYTATLTGDQIALKFGYMFSDEIFVSFTPLQITLITIIICALINMFLSMSMFAISLYCSKSVAIAFGTINVILVFVTKNIHPMVRYQIARFVPLSWIQIAKINTRSLGWCWLPSLPYMLIFLGTAILLLYGVIYYKIQKIDYVWENSK